MDPYSERSQRGPDLQREYERITLSFHAMGGGLWDYDIDGDALYCNARWYEILGLDSATDPIGSVAQFQSRIHPDDVAVATAVDADQVQSLLDKNECYRVEFRIIRPEGAVRWLRSVACIIRDSVTGHLRAIGCVTDITEFRAEAPTSPPPGLLTERMGAAPPPVEAPADPSAPQDQPDRPLTGKERECLVWVSVGKTAWETATILGLSRRTVEFHLANATRKLDAANKVHAAFIALRRNLLTPDRGVQGNQLAGSVSV